jgi:hypothetical protein
LLRQLGIQISDGERRIGKLIRQRIAVESDHGNQRNPTKSHTSR